MSCLTTMTRLVLLVVPTFWFMAGCKPVANSTSAPLPTTNSDSSTNESNREAVVPEDEANGSDDEDALPDVTATDDTGSDATLPEVDSLPEATVPDNDPVGTEPTDTQPESTDAAEGVTDPDGTAPVLSDSTADDAVNDQLPVEDGPDAGHIPTLTIGSVAPPLQIGQWIKGKPIEEFAAGHVYVVEFWATWCGPCRTSMPHISQLQQNHRDDVTCVGITRENEEQVREFMAEVQDDASSKTWNEVIQYNIALDQDSETNLAYMQAAEQSAIPTAFIVGKDGLIEWFGHPLSIDDPLAQVVSDQWDREAALAKLETDREMERVQRDLSIAARRAKETGDWTEVLQMVEKAVLKNPDSSAMKIMQFNVLLVAEEYDNLNRVADQLSALVWDDANYLNRISWQMVTNIPKEKQDLELALKIALRANELAEGNPSVLDTVARVYYEMGDPAAAIQWQKRAVEAAPDKEILRDALEKYEAANKQQ